MAYVKTATLISITSISLWVEVRLKCSVPTMRRSFFSLIYRKNTIESNFNFQKYRYWLKTSQPFSCWPIYLSTRFIMWIICNEILCRLIVCRYKYVCWLKWHNYLIILKISVFNIKINKWQWHTEIKRAKFLVFNLIHFPRNDDWCSDNFWFLTGKNRQKYATLIGYQPCAKHAIQKFVNIFVLDSFDAWPNRLIWTFDREFVVAIEIYVLRFPIRCLSIYIFRFNFKHWYGCYQV